MIHKKTLVYAILVSIITLYSITNKAQQSPIALHVAQRYMSSLSNLKPSPLQEPYALTPQDTQIAAFNVLLGTKRFGTTIIDESSIDKLEIVGGGENVSAHLLGKIFSKNLHTTIGMAHTAFTFCHPTKDITILTKRQQAIQSLSENKAFIKDIDASLKKLKFSERKALILWHPQPPINLEALKSSYFGGIISFSPLKIFNTSPLALELTNKIADLAGYTRTASLFMESAKEAPGAFIKLALRGTEYFVNPLAYPRDLLLSYFFGTGEKETRAVTEPFMLAYNLYKMYKSRGFYDPYQDIMITTASYIKELKQIGAILHKDAITHKENSLLNHMPSLQPLANLATKRNTSDKLNQLLDLLETPTFTGIASFWSYTGRVLVAYKLIQKVQRELSAIITATGELDMYTACAKLYNERNGKNAQYCIVNFVDNETPLINAHNFWNPFVNPDTVVVNDALFDKAYPNYMLTGPNTGGKSTVIKGVLLNLLMAQSFGIAPSTSLTMTPFAKFNCFMNISDDIAQGASLFKSEVIRAKKLLDMVQSLDKKEFSFMIIDEVFTGTSPVEGEIAAMRFAKRLTEYPNNVSIIATHYPKMIQLEEETRGLFRNYHLEIFRNPDGTLNRTFKLKRGPSLINVALDILKEEGMDI